MDCKTFESRIPDFLNDRLDNKELQAFLEHMESCAECREELSIQTLVSKGMEKLETGETFNLKAEMSGMETAARHRLRRRLHLGRTACIAEAAALVSLIGAAAAVIVFVH